MLKSKSIGDIFHGKGGLNIPRVCSCAVRAPPAPGTAPPPGRHRDQPLAAGRGRISISFPFFSFFFFWLPVGSFGFPSGLTSVFPFLIRASCVPIRPPRMSTRGRGPLPFVQTRKRGHAGKTGLKKSNPRPPVAERHAGAFFCAAALAIARGLKYIIPQYREGPSTA